MKLIVKGNINIYYVQTLCMVFFPGEKFAEDEEITPLTPVLELSVSEDENGVEARACMSIGEKKCSDEKRADFKPHFSAERTAKIAVGAAVMSVGSALINYRPSWGMLTGVRPSKVASEYLNMGMSKTRTRKILNSEYLVIPKKAALATEVAQNEARIIGTPDKKDCSVYIGIPFCPTRCSYCSFVSYTSNRLLSMIPEYVVRLIGDVKNIFGMINELGLNVKTVYIGGGTPTILTPEQLELLLSTVYELTDVTKLEEYTLESGRPDTISEEKMALAVKYGVTRVCVNPQTLCPEVLREIGRTHSVEDFFKAYNIARESGIKYINTDLIAGLPGDDFKKFSSSVDRVLELRPDNITVHTFCVKKAADILKNDSSIFSVFGGDVGKCVDYSQLKANAAGYKPYYMYRQKNTIGNFENVGFALDGAEGYYNIYMMEEVHSIFAAGAGAVTKLVQYRSGEDGKTYIKRLFNHKYPYEYLADDKNEENNRQIREFYAQYIF